MSATNRFKTAKQARVRWSLGAVAVLTLALGACLDTAELLEVDLPGRVSECSLESGIFIKSPEFISGNKIIEILFVIVCKLNDF